MLAHHNRLIYSADDYGLHPHVCEGILKLIESHKIQRTSVMVLSPLLKSNPAWTKKLIELKQTHPNLQIGLHFDLTGFGPFQHLSASSFLKHCIKESLQTFFFKERPFFTTIQKELQNQLEIAKNLGLPIEYIDGHHHCHIFPNILATLSPLIQKHGISVIRYPYEPFFVKGTSFFNPRKIVLNILSKLSFSSKNFQYPNFFYYPKQISLQEYLTIPLQFLTKGNVEVICHPAYRTNDGHTIESLLSLNDNYTVARYEEFEILNRL